MIYVFLGKDVRRNRRLVEFLEKEKLPYQLLLYQDIDKTILDFLARYSENFFKLLHSHLQPYSKSETMTYNQLCQIVLQDTAKNLRFPIVVHNGKVHNEFKDRDDFTVLTSPQKRRILRKKRLLQAL